MYNPIAYIVDFGGQLPSSSWPLEIQGKIQQSDGSGGFSVSQVIAINFRGPGTT